VARVADPAAARSAAPVAARAGVMDKSARAGLEMVFGGLHVARQLVGMRGPGNRRSSIFHRRSLIRGSRDSRARPPKFVPSRISAAGC
jgi:hypothetical protein